MLGVAQDDGGCVRSRDKVYRLKEARRAPVRVGDASRPYAATDNGVFLDVTVVDADPADVSGQFG